MGEADDDMPSLSCTPSERARKAHSRVLQSLQEPGAQRHLAAAMGVSEATISRVKTEKLEDAMALLYQLGFKVVPVERVCVDLQMYEAMTRIATRAMADAETARRLVWGDE